MGVTRFVKYGAASETGRVEAVQPAAIITCGATIGDHFPCPAYII